MMKRVDGRDDFQTILMHGGALCVRCRKCGRRGVLQNSAFHEDKTHLINALILKCEMCGSKDIERMLPGSSHQAFVWAISPA